MTPNHRQTISRLDLTARALFQDAKGGQMIFAPHHLAIAAALQSVATGAIRRLIINMPPRSGKTLLVSQMFPAWVMGMNPRAEFILTSYSATLATNNTYVVRELMRGGMYQYLFGENGAQVAQDSKARHFFKTVSGGQMYAVGTGGTITGFGAGKMSGEPFGGCILIDDPAKPDEAQSEIMRQGVIDWYRNTLQSRTNSPETPIVLVSQRLHEDDLAGWLLGGGTGEKWELLKVPAITSAGESFWPDKFPLEHLTRMAESMPYMFAGQYQQDPAPREGALFRPGKIDIIDAVPADIVWVRGWDLAATKNDGDWTVGAKLGVKDGVTYIVDLQRIQGGPEDVERLIVQTAQLDGCKQSIPQDPGQAGVAQMNYLSKKLQGLSFSFSRETGDKATRAEPFAAQVNVGNVRMLRASWNEALLDELRNFPFGKHDDIVDACSRAYNELGTTWNYKELL